MAKKCCIKVLGKFKKFFQETRPFNTLLTLPESDFLYTGVKTGNLYKTSISRLGSESG